MLIHRLENYIKLYFSKICADVKNWNAFVFLTKSKQLDNL